MNGDSRIGPSLDGIINRRIRLVKDYVYSEPLEKARGNWTSGKLNKFMQDPQKMYPGTSMQFSMPLENYERRAILRYLSGIKAVPAKEDKN